MSKRMIDLLFTDGSWKRDLRDNSHTHFDIADIQDRTRGLRFFEEAEVLVIDNVTRYLYEDNPQEQWESEDFPNCAPPFPVFWMETRHPSSMLSGTVRRAWNGPHAWGALFIAHDLQALLQEGIPGELLDRRLTTMIQQHWRAVLLAFHHHGISMPQTPPATLEHGKAWFASLPEECQKRLSLYCTLTRLERQTVLKELPAQVRWQYTVIPFMQLVHGGRIDGPLMAGNILVQADGQLFTHHGSSGEHKKIGDWSGEHAEYLTYEEQEQFVTYGRCAHYPMWLALSFLHCKNVTLTKQDPCHQRKPPKRGEVCRRAHYHALNIRPMQDVLRREGHSEQTGIKKALHICRGHFKDYRQRGLFGRHQGLYWWESHLRGHSEHGVIAKDYQVHA